MVRIVLDLRELERELGDEVQQFLLDLANELINELKANAPVGATGDLRRSIQVFSTRDGRVVLGTRLNYAGFVVTGTRPHTPPFEPIRVWARRVLGDESAAGAVWHSIRENGTEGNDFATPSIENAVRRVSGP